MSQTVTSIPDYIKPKPGLSLEYHGSYPQAARIATKEGLKPGKHAWMDRIREIRQHWRDTNQI